MRRFHRGLDSRLWPVLTLLLVAALLPMACVLWFMGEAMRNEQLAARQKLLEAYRTPLERVQARLGEYWQSELGHDWPADAPSVEKAGALFAERVAEGRCDSVVFYDADGGVVYPGRAAGADVETVAIGPEWEAAEALEFQGEDAETAAVLYLEAAQAARKPVHKVRARIAAARCLARVGRKPEAVELLERLFQDRVAQEARESDGRWPVIDANLLLLELLAADPAAQGERATVLAPVARTYGSNWMPAGQRRGLMEALVPFVGPEAFPTLPAERLAAEYVDAQGATPVRGRLTRAPLAGVWQLASKDGRAVALYREAGLEKQMGAILASEAVSGATIRLVRPEEHGADSFLAVPAAEAMPLWQLALTLKGVDAFADAAKRRMAIYLWTGVAVALLTAAMTLLVGRFVGRQVQLTRLKNDLIATVSHELKTPLAGIRALVDTLLDKGSADPVQAREYLQLIARENLRLSRLIDNFLAFSRMERNRHAFEFAEVDPAEVVAAAVEAAGERFAAPDCRLETQVAPGLPRVTADRDALLTVLLNLLDNAHKYTGAEKRIHLRAWAAEGGVRFEVQDNGIGLSRRAARRVFDRFYQADRHLSRQAGGCGLGLSIVKFIVEAHGGKVHVKSQPGSGSTFVVSLPVGLRTENQALKTDN